MKLMHYPALVPLAWLLAVGGIPAGSSAPSQVDYGMGGLRRIQLVFVDLAPLDSATDGRSGGDDSAIVGDAGPLGRRIAARRGAPPPAFAAEEECRAIPGAVAGGGLKIVDRCLPEDAECGTLFLTLEAVPSGDESLLYVVTMELSQRIRLARDPARTLAMPTTWSERRFGLVPRPVLERTACERLHDLANWFAALWQAANE